MFNNVQMNFTFTIVVNPIGLSLQTSIMSKFSKPSYFEQNNKTNLLQYNISYVTQNSSYV